MPDLERGLWGRWRKWITRRDETFLLVAMTGVIGALAIAALAGAIGLALTGNNFPVPQAPELAMLPSTQPATTGLGRREPPTTTGAGHREAPPPLAPTAPRSLK